MGHGRRKRQPAHSGATALRQPRRSLQRNATSESKRPTLLPALAAAIAGGVCGLVGVLLVSLGEQGCDAAPSRSSCAGGAGVMMLITVTAACILLGALVLRALAVPDAVLVAFFGVAAALIFIVWFLLGHVFSTWMLVVVPLLAATTFALSALGMKTLARMSAARDRSRASRRPPDSDAATDTVAATEPTPTAHVAPSHGSPSMYEPAEAAQSEGASSHARYAAPTGASAAGLNISGSPSYGEATPRASAATQVEVATRREKLPDERPRASHAEWLSDQTAPPVLPRRRASVAPWPQQAGSGATRPQHAAQATPRPHQAPPLTSGPRHAAPVTPRQTYGGSATTRPKHAAPVATNDTVAVWPEPDRSIPHQPRHASSSRRTPPTAR